MLYTDLKAAFDKIDHQILLNKLSRLGISTQLVSWLESYLTNRELRVRINGCVARAFTNNSGVPQGSNLGPPLFILFFNDAALILNRGCFKLVYAEDLRLYAVIQTQEDCRRLQTCLSLFVDWCHRNKLIVSVEKCQVISFHRKSQPIIHDYHIDGMTLTRVTEVTDLGILLDSKMTFDLHRSGLIPKATRQLGFVSKVAKDFSDPHCWKAMHTVQLYDRF